MNKDKTKECPRCHGTCSSCTFGKPNPLVVAHNAGYSQGSQHRATEIMTEMFDSLPEWIDEHYPKGTTKERGCATVALSLFIIEYTKKNKISTHFNV